MEGFNAGLGKNLPAPEEKATKDTMSDGGIFKAKMVFIKHSEQDGPRNGVNVLQGKTFQLKHPVDHVRLPQITPSFSVRAENTRNRLADGTASMETAVDKHRGISPQPCHHISPCAAEVSSDCFVNRASEDRASPTDSADLFPTPASSRESILSEGWDKEKSWSAMQLSNGDDPFSRTASPCSSARSGVFSPAVVRVRRHALAPGSSLLHMAQSAFSSCESLSMCPLSPPPSRRRPPLTRLSLLTAILRKGRLPVLSSAQQRPYSPCWPINPVTLSSCNACSAASSLSSIPLEVSSRPQSSASIGRLVHKPYHGETYRCETAPPSVQSKDHCRARDNPPSPPIRRSDRVYSNYRALSPPVITQNHLTQSLNKNDARPQVLPVAAQQSPTAELKPRSPGLVKHKEISESKSYNQLPHSSAPRSKSDSPELELSNNVINVRGHAAYNSLDPKLYPKLYKKETSLSGEQSSQSYASLPGLDYRSLQQSPLPSCTSESRASTSYSSPTRSVSVSPVQRHCAISPPPPVQDTVKGPCRPHQSPPAPSSDRLSQPPKAHLLSPSRYTPIVFHGWPSPVNSRCSTPDRFTLSPSPAPSARDLLTPSPSLSVRSTPSPRPWLGISDCIDREGKKRKPHKIKSSYKSLAAIPTNTILLDQQAIDDQVERNEHPTDTQDSCVTDTHVEMCSPAQLRQQSAELYAVIDEILEDSIPKCHTSREHQRPNATQQNTSMPRLGRETKYASLCSLNSSTSAEGKLLDTNKTKPGVIRPLNAIPRLTVEDEESHPNPFRQYVAEPTVTDQNMPSRPIVTIHENEALISNKLEREMDKEKHENVEGHTYKGEEGKKHKKGNTFSMSALLITETEDHGTL